jgi:hypothetical protein
MPMAQIHRMGSAIDAGQMSSRFGNDRSRTRRPIMTALGLVGGRKSALAPARIYTIEYTSSEHRGIIMYSEAHEAASADAALVYAKGRLPDMGAKYGARGYRVKDANGRSHGSDGSGFEPL